ncbi:hypothetical protein ScPMuIL_005992 [Solemya velum]
MESMMLEINRKTTGRLSEPLARLIDKGRYRMKLGKRNQRKLMKFRQRMQSSGRRFRPIPEEILLGRTESREGVSPSVTQEFLRRPCYDNVVRPKQHKNEPSTTGKADKKCKNLPIKGFLGKLKKVFTFRRFITIA